MHRSDTDVESTIADYATSFSLNDAPASAKRKAKLVLLDTLGVCFRGSRTEYVRDSVDAYATFVGDGGDSTILATRTTGSPVVAAELNAAGGTCLELDEGNQRSAHMGIHAVPPAIAVAEARNSSGDELLEAVVLAYEVGARLGNLVRPMNGDLHPHGAWAPAAGAVATARLLNFDASEYREAIRMAVNPFVVGDWAACLEGATVRNFYSGISCAHGMKAALLATSGVTGVQNSVDRCLLTYAAEREVTPRAIADEFDTLGEEFYLDDSYFKIHAACRYAHAPVEALERLLDSNDIDPDDIERIVVRTHAAGTRLSNTSPENVLSAKFSTPYALAARLLFGTAGVDAFSEARIVRDDVRSLADRVDVVLDSRYDAAADEGDWGAEVELLTTGGATISASVENARGGGDAPFSETEVVDKFEDLTADVVSTETATALTETILNVEDVANVAELLAPLR